MLIPFPLKGTYLATMCCFPAAKWATPLRVDGGCSGVLLVDTEQVNSRTHAPIK